MTGTMLTSLALPSLSYKFTSTPSNPSLHPQAVAFQGLAPPKIIPSTRVSSLVVRAKPEDGWVSKEIISPFDPSLVQLNLNMKLPNTPPNFRGGPWSTSEDENEMRMWFDMPGLGAEGIDVYVENDMLIIKGSKNMDASGKKFDCKLQLPTNCAKDETHAVLKNGALYITVPKITKDEHLKSIRVPVKVIKS